MTPKLVRINVAVDPRTKATVEELADLMGTSFAKFAGSMLDDSRPQLEGLRDAIKHAKNSPGSGHTSLHLALIEAQRQALEAQSDFLNRVADNRKSDA